MTSHADYDYIEGLKARIVTLENALREIAEWDDNGDQIAGDIARAALAPEQDK